MKTHPIAESLAAVPLFQDLPQNYLEILSGCASNVRFEKGDFLLLEGKQARTFFVVREGKVAVEVSGGNRNAITIETLESGDVLGWSWLVAPYRWQFDARAITPVAAVSFDAVCLREKCARDNGLGYEILRRFSEIISQRLMATRLQLLDLYQ